MEEGVSGGKSVKVRRGIGEWKGGMVEDNVGEKVARK